jgi:hypothetical protein
MALEAWSRSIAQLVSKPHVSVLHLYRNETDRQLSVYRRFHGLGGFLNDTQRVAAFCNSSMSFFDCELPRPPSDFDRRASELAPDGIQIETCWASPDGAGACIAKALRAIGVPPAVSVSAAAVEEFNPKREEHHRDEDADVEITSGATCAAGGALHFISSGELVPIARSDIPDFSWQLSPRLKWDATTGTYCDYCPQRTE